jgi:uncharacterized protein YcnI
VALAAGLAAMLLTAAPAAAHARLSPPVSIAGEVQLYSLAVPTEKPSPVTTTKIVLVTPEGFSIDSFVPSPGWRRSVQVSASGSNAVVERVTWSGGRVPSGEDSLFQFLGEASAPGTYAFEVEQTYSDGSIVDWTGGEASPTPAPTIEAKTSLGGGGTSLLTIAALIAGALGVLIACVALLAGGGKRPLA